MIVLCLHCLEEAATLGFDKRGSPYVRCSHCGSMSFLKHPDAMRGLAVGAEVLRDVLERVRHNPELARSFDAEVEGFRAKLASRMLELQRAASATQQPAQTVQQPAAAPAQIGFSAALREAKASGGAK